jgi:hypothetical protein
MNYTSVTNPIWVNQEHTAIICMVVFTDLGPTPVPFTADQNATYDYEAQIFNDCAAGVYGPVAAYVPPVATAGQNKTEAEKRLAATDWVNEPDVYDPASNPHLTNRSDFITYRDAIRPIAVYPVAGNLNWPTEPTAVWVS